MRKKSFKQKYIIFLVLVCFIVLGLYYSYAIFVTKQLQENVFVLKTNNHDVSLTINGNDSKYKINSYKDDNVTLTLSNKSNNNYFYEIFFKSDSHIMVTSKEQKGEIKPYETMKINVTVSNNDSKEKEVIFKVLISKNDDIEKEIDYSYINEEENFDHSHANRPNISDLHLIPIAYNREEGFWYKGDINNKEDLWYDYDHGIWANALLVNDKDYHILNEMAIGEEVDVTSSLGLYVWIPRFKYVILNNSNYTSFERMYNVLFEKDNNTTGTIVCEDRLSNGDFIYSEMCKDVVNNKIYDNLSTYTHPAFKDREGFWISKFLMNEGSTLKSLPNAKISKKKVFDAINLSENLIKGKTHLLTNMEYASIILLSNSQYGKTGNNMYQSTDNYHFQRVYANTYSYDLTGCSTEFNQYTKNFSNTLSNNCVEYNNLTNYSHVSNSINYPIGEIGPGASSTGTIYGVYDLANRNGEMVAGFSYSLKDKIKTSYYDLYSDSNYQGKVASSKSIKYLYRYKLGDMIRESFRTISENGMWNSGLLEQKENGVILRGGSGEMKNASVYTASFVSVDTEAPFRVVIK